MCLYALLITYRVLPGVKMLSTHSSFFVPSNGTFSADSVVGWDQLVLDFAPGLLPRAGKWSQLIPSVHPLAPTCVSTPGL